MEDMFGKLSVAAAVSPVTQTSAGNNHSGNRRRRLGTPLQGHGLSAPSSASSLDLSCSPSSSLDSRAGLTPNLASPAAHDFPAIMSRLLPGEPTPPPPNTKAAISGIRNTFGASKRMQQALGFQGGLTPFERPPTMPNDLIEAYYEGWYEYGADVVGTNLSPVKEDSHEYLEGYEKLGSEDEADNTVRWGDNHLCNNDETVPLLGSSESLPYEEGADDRNHLDQGNHHDGGSREFGEQAATDNTYDPSEPRNNTEATLHDLSGLLNTQEVTVSTQDRTKKVLRLPSGGNLRSLHNELAAVGDGGLFEPGLVNPVLRPSSSHSDAGSVLSALAGRAPLEASLSLHPDPEHFFSTLFSGPALLRSTTSLPDIIVTSSASPLPASRKRRAQVQEDSDTEDMPPSNRPTSSFVQVQPTKKARSNPIPTGLRALDSSEAWGWLSNFPRNTAGLICTLITWHTTMQSFFAQVKDARLLSSHPMFPYPPSKPKNIPLVSAGFWDTGGETHRELWYIGPGDVEVLSYNEVDTFSTRAELDSDQYKIHSRFKRLLKRDEMGGKEMRDRALTGDGRWSFIVMRGHAVQTHSHKSTTQSASQCQNESGEVAPYVFIAFPTSAITKSTECLHMLYPDDYKPPAAPAKPAADLARPNRPVTITGKPSVARVASMPMLGMATMPSYYVLPPAAPAKPAADLAQPNRPVTITKEPSVARVASIPMLGMATMPSYYGLSDTRRPLSTLDSNAPTYRPPPLKSLREASDALVNQGNNQPLRRTIMWFEKAGQLPLIEGYKTNLTLWQPFLEAVGKGQAKLMLWCETEERVI